MKHKSKKHLKSSWVSKKGMTITDKPWGTEKSWGGFSGIHGKFLFIKKNKRTSLKFNKLKTEVLILRVGKIEVIFGNEASLTDSIENPLETSVMDAGDTLFVQSCCPYRITALEDSEIIEIGDHIGEKSIRIIDDFGRESNDIDNFVEVLSEHT
jgi:hypothetical protein